jgi:deoxyxylulose-5-phosphate synthase
MQTTENETTIIMDTGEPYVHIATLVEYLREKGIEAIVADPTLVPGIAVVVDFLTKEHDRNVLLDRKD